MKNFLQHARSYIFRGFLAIIPISLCYLAVRLLYILIDKRVVGFLNEFIEVRQIPGLGILLALVALYLIGLIVSNIIGRQLLKLIEVITTRIPFIKAVYSVGKQLSQSLGVAEEEKKAFKKAILVNINNNNLLILAFLTGTVQNEATGEEMFLVFIPKVPNPTTGYVAVVSKSQTVDPGWSIEEGIKMVFSAGIINPKIIRNVKEQGNGSQGPS